MFVIASNSSYAEAGTTITVQVIQIALSITTVALGLIIGLILRRKILQRLKKTVLDAWLIQTLGILAILPTLILACITLPIILRWGSLTLDQLANQATEFIFNAEFPDLLRNTVGTIILVALGVGSARTAQVLTIRGLSEKRIDINLRTLFGRILYIIILIIMAFWILAIWNISIGIPVAAIGVITAAVVVSIQDILKDLVAGLYILLERPFYIGNVISISTYLGRVEDVQLRATKLRLLSGEEVSIPNSLVFSGTVVNTSYYGERRATIKIDILQEDFVTVETAQQILNTIKEVEGVAHNQQPTVVFSGYAAEKMTFTVRFWVANQQNEVISDVMYSLHMLLPNADLAVVDFAGNV
ncbi:MAG TPA: mechanosensitive ion channel domain-containing protein [Ktedonobacteraceae bacterium]|nr:mechanosensitive ion channel domain-containing protein [Ktedonobacteraceae bacterium]